MMVIFSKAKTREIAWNTKPEMKKVKLLVVCLYSRFEFMDHVNYLFKICSYKMSSIRKTEQWPTDKNLIDVVSCQPGLEGQECQLKDHDARFKLA